MAKHQFQTEVNQLLHLMIHSLYSNKEIFLRELVSNASDALDKLKLLTLTDDEFKDLEFNPKIDIAFDNENQKTITIMDNGIGMSDEDLVEHLGTIAKSGTKSFVEQLSGDTKKDSNLIGQFGVGFYSSFMVAKKVEVISKKAGSDKAYKWISEGKGEYEITQADRSEQGTTIILYLKDDAKEFASRWRIEEIVQKYSNHIPYPIFLKYKEKEYDDKGNEKGEKEKYEQINKATALWRLPKSQIKEDEYKEFYKTISHDNEEPLLYIHTHAEGTLEYTTLFYIPKKAPFDLYRVDYQPGVKLYVKRVFITDDDKELLPTYLRFVKGIIDSEDLPLNVSREILQQNKILANIKQASVKKILGEFKKLANKDKEKYDQFIEQFNKPLKEGVYQDFTNREELLELIRFKSSKVDGWVSLKDYKERMPKDQKSIYYIVGEKIDTLKNSPLLEAYKQKDYEVLLLSDEIDEIVMPTITSYKETPLKAINKSDADDDFKDNIDEKTQKEFEDVLKKMKDILKDEVKDVKLSPRLSESPSCVVRVNWLENSNIITPSAPESVEVMITEFPTIPKLVDGICITLFI